MRLGVLTLGCLLSGCSSCSPNPASPASDAGEVLQPRPDGGTFEAGSAKDAASAAEAGGGLEAGTAFPNPLNGTWNVLPGEPASCQLRVAATPSTSVPQLAWAPCSSGRSGCRTLIVDWSNSTNRYTIYFGGVEPVRLIAGAPYMVYARGYPNPTTADFGAFIAVVQPLDGMPKFAIGAYTGTATLNCSFDVGIGEYGAVVRVSDDTIPGSSKLVAWSPWAALPAMSTASVPTSTLGAGALGYPAVGASKFFFHTQNPGTIDIFDPSSSSMGLAYSSPPTRLPAEEPRAVADGALAIWTGSPPGLVLVRGDGTSSNLVVPTTPQVLTYFSVDRSSGDAIAWVESDDTTTYANSTIWTAPYTTSAATLGRRPVARLSGNARGGYHMVTNRGVVLNVIDQGAVATRLSDGMGWAIAPEQGEAFVDPIWIDDDELWLTTAKLGPNYQSHTSGVLRIQRSALGAPTVASGL